MMEMRNLRILRAILLLNLICLFSFPAKADFTGGIGEPNDPYRIATTGDLMLLGDRPDDYDKHFVLTADIDLDPNLPSRKIFNEAVIAPPAFSLSGFQGTFTGVFDGNDYKISNLTIAGESYLGLFGYLEPGAKIVNLGL